MQLLAAGLSKQLASLSAVALITRRADGEPWLLFERRSVHELFVAPVPAGPCALARGVHVASMDCGRLLAGIALALCSSFSPGIRAEDVPRYRWEADDEAHGLRVFTSEVAEHGYDAMKITATLPVPVLPLLEALQDFSAYPSWYHHAAAVSELSRPPSPPAVRVQSDGRLEQVGPAGPWLLLFVQHTPPIADRWAVLRCFMRPGPQGSVRFAFHSEASHPELAPQGAVRMRLHGFWQLTPVDRAHTAVTFVLDVDPNTGTPAFLVDPVLRETAIETVRGLQRVGAERARRPAAARVVR